MSAKIRTNYKDVEASLNRLSRKIATSDYNRRCANAFIAELREAVVTQKYSFESYNDKYELWKARNYGGLGFAELGGDFLAALSVWKMERAHVKGASAKGLGAGWAGGVPEGQMDSGGKGWSKKSPPKEIAMYMSVFEFGGDYGEGGNHPSRPLFQNTLKDFSEGTGAKIGQLVLEDMAAAWRGTTL